jgi:hypothetical protein
MSSVESLKNQRWRCPEARLRKLAGRLFRVIGCSLLGPASLSAYGCRTSIDSDTEAEYNYILTQDKFAKLIAIQAAWADWVYAHGLTAKDFARYNSRIEALIAKEANIIDIKFPQLAPLCHEHDMTTEEYWLGARVMTHALPLHDAIEEGKTTE